MKSAMVASNDTTVLGEVGGRRLCILELTLSVWTRAGCCLSAGELLGLWKAVRRQRACGPPWGRGGIRRFTVMSSGLA